MATAEAHHVIAAEPGWRLVTLLQDQGELFYEPIIAWVIERHTSGDLTWWETRPLTCEGDDDSGDMPWALKRPDGTFVLPSDAYPVDEAAAIGFLQRRWEAYKVRGAARKEA
jgi:hypothetical protein